MSEALDQKLSALKLARMRQVYASWIEQAERLELGYGEVLDQLATEELLARQENHLRRQMKAAGFPTITLHNAPRLFDHNQHKGSDGCWFCCGRAKRHDPRSLYRSPTMRP